MFLNTSIKARVILSFTSLHVQPKMNQTNNNSSSNTTVSLESQSIAMIRGFTSQLTVLASASAVNLLACLLSSVILWRQRANLFISRVFLLLRIFLVNDAATSTFGLSFALWHMQNGWRGVPEIVPRPTCFAYIGVLYFMMINSNLISMAIGLDRLQSVWAPTKAAGLAAHEFQLSAATMAMIGVPFGVSGAIYLVALLDNEVSDVLFHNLDFISF